MALPPDIKFLEPPTDPEVQKLLGLMREAIHEITCPPDTIFFLSRAPHAQTATGVAMALEAKRWGMIKNVKAE